MITDGFRKCADIDRDDRAACFVNREDGFSNQGYIYLWVEDGTVVYVGKAGRSMKNRFGQHRGGFKYSHTGQGHNARILEGIRHGKHYSVYAKETPLASIDSVEQEFIRTFDQGQLWNRKLYR